MSDKIKYLIIGNSAGGIGAAEAIREVDDSGSITIISDEPYPVYSRPMISEFLAEKCSVERMLFRPTSFYEKNDIQTILGSKVVQLDTKEHSITLEGGKKLFWEKLLLATGGVPIVPQVEGIGLKGVFTFTTLDDAKAISNFLDQHSGRPVSATVIGGGLIGVSVTEALVKRGVKVTIVEMRERILNVLLDEEASAIEAAALKQAGVEIITGHTVSKVSSYLPGEATGVTLDNDRPFPCKMVILAIGVRPRTELAVNAGIKVNRGIVVDNHMATSQADVYACGDAAEAFDFVYGENRLSPIWPNAYLGGRIAGFNMAGVPTNYPGGTAMNSMKYFGVSIVSAGMPSPPDNSYEVLRRKRGRTYKKVILKAGRIVGMVYSNDIEKSGIIYNLMKNGVDVEDFKESLVSDNFGLISVPEEIWRPITYQASAVTSVTTQAMPVEEMPAGD